MSKFAGIVCAAVVFIGSTGCNALGLSGSDDKDRLASARKTWNARHISNYSFTYSAECFCPSEVRDSVRVVVRADTILSLTYVATGQPVPANYRTTWRTIPGLFDFIDEAFSRKAESLVVTYDPTFGFPSRAVIDYVKQAVDEEYNFNVSSFHAD